LEITVTDSQNTPAEVTKTYDLTIYPEPLALETESQPGAQVDVTYEATHVATGGVEPYTWSATGLPDGLTIDPTTGVITGHPLIGADGDHQIEITVIDNQDPTAQTTQTFDLTEIGRASCRESV